MMALPHTTRKALEYSALFLEAALMRAHTVEERQTAIRQLHNLIRNMYEAGAEPRDFSKLFKASEKVFLDVLDEVRASRDGRRNSTLEDSDGALHS